MQGDLSPITEALRQFWWWRYRVRVFSYRDRILLVRYNRLHLVPICSYEFWVPACEGDGLLSFLTGCMEKMQRRKRDRDDLEVGAGGLVDEEFKTFYPSLWEHLTADRFEDGATRKTSSLLVFSQDGRIKLMLKDKEEGEVAFLSATGVTSGLAALEEGLAAGKLDWRRDKEAPARKGSGPPRKA